MSKYRIIRSVAADKDKPYFPQYWNTKEDRWANYQHAEVFGYGWADLSFATFKEAKKYIREQQEQEEINNTPAEVVWEEDTDE